ncbi:hypothetical protein DFQ28_004345 [Apophysomyces sp. BC1034]|nr:hypothetical protein DFQ30_004438 [Apophysomyces sp. BC1015]KAG0178387.1 hypothetical protein DFQ29_003533 [Apophysomyces sp. BC1021]KAG0188806.1 hypothetical protein DFQ28_004345 [Apophysomyces sp. BC1034]
MGAQSSKEVPSLNEKQSQALATAAAAEMEAMYFSPSSKEKYLSQSLATLNLNEDQVKARYAQLSHESLSKFSHGFWQDPKNRLALNAIKDNNPLDIIVNHGANLKDDHVFNVKLDLEGAATNQRSSGRCWLFADKLEKANWFLENQIDLANEDINDRVVQYLLKDPVGDGGQWDMFVNIVKKYGVVPKTAYPESYSSSNSSRLNWLVTVKLREFAVQIRKAIRDGVSVNTVRVLKQEMLEDVYRTLVICLGEPPKKFDWETKDKNDKFIGIRGLTPKGFLEEIVQYPVENTMSLINDPRNPTSRLYTVDRLGNVVGGSLVRYVNTEISTIKQLLVNVLKSGSPVWFGCDVGQFSSSKYAVMDTNIYDYGLAFNLQFNLTKEQRLLYGESSMTHAMVFTGVHLDEQGSPVRWRVENSWGPDSGDKGYWVMNDEWFSEFVYQVVLEKSAVPRKLVALFDTEPTILPAYDPMGSLATH